jgi:hypothetical protein
MPPLVTTRSNSCDCLRTYFEEKRAGIPFGEETEARIGEQAAIGLSAIRKLFLIIHLVANFFLVIAEDGHTF